MYRIVGNVLPRSILIILTAIAVMGSFSLAAAEPVRAAFLAAEWRAGLSEEAYYFFSENDGDMELFVKSDDNRNIYLRIDSQRVSASSGLNRPGRTYCPSQFWAILKNGFLSNEEIILLKLRV